MLIPGPDHPIVAEPAKRRWRALFAGHVIADTNDALILMERNYPAVVYFPRQDVAMEYMSRSDRRTNCPYKGDATYYTIVMNGQFAENAVWTYEQPYPAMEQITGRLAFYPDKVEVYEVDDEVVNKHKHHPDVDEVVLHTDAGDGHSQREHWEPTVDMPAPEEEEELRP